MKQIAIIDDDVYIGDMLEEILIKEGYDVIRAYSGTEDLLGVSDKINLLLSGAVDYMTKPFETKELLARIVVSLRKKSVNSEIQVLYALP